MKTDFKLGLKHWTGTAIVAVLAGFVIFGLLRGQEILNDFLKSEPTDANLERGELLVLIPSPSPKLISKPTPLEAARTRPERSRESPQRASTSYGARSTPLPLTGPTPKPLPSLMPTPSPSSLPTPKPTSSPMPISTPTPILTPTFSPTPTPFYVYESTPSPTPSQTPLPTPSVAAVVINEIAWMGTKANSADEWIELYNSNSSNIDISGWTLKSVSDSKPDIIFPEGSNIPAFGYFLIERTDDNTIKDIPADLKIGFGSGAGSGLSNSGEILHLYDGQGNLKDIVGHKDETGQVVLWYFGHNTSKSTMERVNPVNPGLGNEPSNWQTNNGITKNGLDAEGNPINGTPKAKNSRQVY